MTSATAKTEECALIMAPAGNDAAAMAELFREHGIETEIFSHMEALLPKLDQGVGMLLLTEEALAMPYAEDLQNHLKSQPAWSELPVIVLSSGGESRLSQVLDQTMLAAGSIMVLERPMKAATLLRSAEVALRSRRRQYQVRDLLAVQERAVETQSRLAAIVESSDDAIVSKTLDGIIRTWNRGAERILGYTAQEAVGRSISIIIPPHLWNEELATLEKLRHGQRVADFETTRVTKDGRLLDASLSISPVRDASGKIIGASKILRDITEQKRAQSALRESEERFRTLAENIPQLAWMWDDQGRAVWFNRRWLEFTGDTMEEMKSGSWQKMLHPDHAPRAAESFNEAVQSGEPWEETFLLRNKEGVYRWFLTRAFPIRDSSGKVTRWFGTSTDITEHKNFEAELERMVAERTVDLRSSNEQLETFVYSAAHDLRAPLRSMSGYSQLLRDDYAASLPEAAQHLLKRIQASAEFMDKLLLDLLAYGRTAQAEMDLVPVDIHQAWAVALSQCGSQIEQTGAEIETIEPLPRVRAHEPTLGQILANLLSNALKFVAPSVRPHVRFWAEEKGENVRLWVEDNGIGIPMEQKERVFRVFERLHGAQYPGTGIGLSIVRKGVERMGGAVGLESKPGHGSRIWIELKKANLKPRAA
jgi:PAS domain S-box-containing protein